VGGDRIGAAVTGGEEADASAPGTFRFDLLSLTPALARTEKQGLADRRPEPSLRTRFRYFSEIEKSTEAVCSGFTLTFLAQVTGWL